MNVTQKISTTTTSNCRITSVYSFFKFGNIDVTDKIIRERHIIFLIVGVGFTL